MNVLLAVGIAIVLGFVAGKLLNRIKIPAVTGWVIMGVVLGSSVTGVFSEDILSRVGILFDLALGFIAFNIGEELRISQLRKLGKSIACIVIGEALGAFLLVTLVVMAITRNLAQALILGAVSSATAPAATMMVLQELGAKGILTTTILSVVAIDDAIALILYAIASSFARIFIIPGLNFSIISAFLPPLEEILGALFLGAGLGALVSLSSRWIRSSTDFFIIVVTALLLNIGIATSFNFSPLLANMSLGMTIANLSPRPLHRIFNVWRTSTPVLYIAFFCLAGAHLNIRLLPQIGLLGLAYTGARMMGKFMGASFGARVSHASPTVQKFIGFPLFPQVGVALALAVLVGREFAPYGETGRMLATLVINILLLTTVITEIVGPYLTRWSLIKAGEARIKEA